MRLFFYEVTEQTVLKSMSTMSTHAYNYNDGKFYKIKKVPESKDSDKPVRIMNRAS